MYDARLIANYFLALGNRDQVPIDPMKIQKLVYFAHGWYLAIVKKPLVSETVEAWKWGPVIPSLYRCFSKYGRNPITEPATDMTVSLLKSMPPNLGEIPSSADEGALIPILDGVWRAYGSQSGIQLSNLTHLPDTPWEKTWSANEGRQGKDIDDALIQQYFERSINGGERQAS